MMRLALSCLCLSLVGGQAIAQSDGPTVESVLQARRVLDRAIEAVGGRAALNGVRTFESVESIRRTAARQGLRPSVPSVIDGRRTLTLDLPRRRIAELRLLDITGNQLWDLQSIVTPDTAVAIYWPNLTITALPRSAWIGERAAITRRHLLPLLLAMDRRPQAVRLLPSSVDDGRVDDALSYADVDGASVTLFVDRRTALPTRIEQFVTDAAVGDTVVATTFADYRTVAGLKLPHRIAEFRPPGTRTDYAVERISVNQPLDEKAFAVPANLQPAASPPSGVVQLAKDVYLVPNQYESVFVAFDDYVVVLEGGGSTGQTQYTIDRIKAMVPGRPIKYVVSTHFHSDHIAGLRSFIAEGATIVTTRDAVAPIGALARATPRLFPDSLSRAPKQPDIETVDRERVFRDAHHEIRLYQIGPSPHVAEILIAHLPNERILFEGDLLDIVDGQPVAGGDDTKDFAAKVRALGLAFDSIVPVHGIPGPASDLEKSLRRGEARAKCPTGAQRREPCALDRPSGATRR